MTRTLDEAECTALERRLTVAIEAKDTATLRDVIVQLCGAGKTPGTGLGKTVRKVSKHRSVGDARLRQAARAVRAYWKTRKAAAAAEAAEAAAAAEAAEAAAEAEAEAEAALEAATRAEAAEMTAASACAFWKTALSRKEETAAEGLRRGGGVSPGTFAKVSADALELVFNWMSPPPLQPQRPMLEEDRQTFAWPADVVPGQVYTCTHDGRNLEVAAPFHARAGAPFAVTIPWRIRPHELVRYDREDEFFLGEYDWNLFSIILAINRVGQMPIKTLIHEGLSRELLLDTTKESKDEFMAKVYAIAETKKVDEGGKTVTYVVLKAVTIEKYGLDVRVDRRVRDIKRFQAAGAFSGFQAFRDAAGQVLAQEEQRELEYWAALEENERLADMTPEEEERMTDTIKALAIELSDAKPAHVPPDEWPANPRNIRKDVVARGLLMYFEPWLIDYDPREWPGWEDYDPRSFGRLQRLRDQYPECREIIDRLFAALQTYNDGRSSRLDA